MHLIAWRENPIHGLEGQSNSWPAPTKMSFAGGIMSTLVVFDARYICVPASALAGMSSISCAERLVTFHKGTVFTLIKADM